MAVRLTKQSWSAIKVAYLQGRTAKELAQQFGVTANTIHNRSSLERWRDGIPVPSARLLATNCDAALAQVIERQTVAAESLTRQGGVA